MVYCSVSHVATTGLRTETIPSLCIRALKLVLLGGFILKETLQDLPSLVREMQVMRPYRYIYTLGRCNLGMVCRNWRANICDGHALFAFYAQLIWLGD